MCCARAVAVGRAPFVPLRRRHPPRCHCMLRAPCSRCRCQAHALYTTTPSSPSALPLSVWCVAPNLAVIAPRAICAFESLDALCASAQRPKPQHRHPTLCMPSGPDAPPSLGLPAPPFVPTAPPHHAHRTRGNPRFPTPPFNSVLAGLLALVG